MVRVLVLVEGQTEERFVIDVLTPYFEQKQIYLSPKILTTKVVKSGKDFKGGVSTFGQIEKHLKILLGDGNAYVTTLIDYYGLPAETPGMSDRPPGSPVERVSHVENAIHVKFHSDKRLIPYLMLHEFEALLFSDPAELAAAIPARNLLPDLIAAMAGLAPEHINETPSAAPSKRILRVIPGYRKVLHGTTTARRIGLGTLREKCPHFGGWLRRLETLAVLG